MIDKMVADGYDPLDPFGKIIIKWDLLLSSPGQHHVTLLPSLVFFYSSPYFLVSFISVSDYRTRMSLR